MTSPSPGLEHHAVAAADEGGRRENEHRIVAIGRLYRITGNLQRICMLVDDGRKRNFIPAVADGKTGIVEIARLAGLCQHDQRD